MPTTEIDPPPPSRPAPNGHPDIRQARPPAPPSKLRAALPPEREAAKSAFHRARGQTGHAQFHRSPAQSPGAGPAPAPPRYCFAYPAGASQFAAKETPTTTSKTAHAKL